MPALTVILSLISRSNPASSRAALVLRRVKKTNAGDQVLSEDLSGRGDDPSLFAYISACIW